MSLFTLIKNVAAAKFDRATAGPEHKPQRTLVPLGLHQGSAVQIPDLDIALAQADGSIIPSVNATQTITAVGRQSIFGMNVYHCYLSDGKSFLRVVAKNLEVQDVQLFVARDEVVPQSKEDWEFWLGRYQRQVIRENDGEMARDPGRSVLIEAGLIGWPQFQVDGPPAIQYNRAWNPGTEGIEPIEYNETIVDSMGESTRVKHEGMEYVRQIGGGENPTTELLLVSMASCGNDASVDIFVGIPLNIRDLKVLAAS